MEREAPPQPQPEEVGVVGFVVGGITGGTTVGSGRMIKSSSTNTPPSKPTRKV
ncbi:MAG: hypothetical protein LBU27_06755 [Candidatus Peribacteria bacterium]|nr:hypothetical protein [Candidatus Peribacteria bacterium]